MDRERPNRSFEIYRNEDLEAQAKAAKLISQQTRDTCPGLPVRKRTIMFLARQLVRPTKFEGK